MNYKLSQLSLCAALLLSSAGHAMAQNFTPVPSNAGSTAATSCTANLRENEDYKKIKVAPEASLAQKMKKDVIIEFFSYACIHCANLYIPLAEAQEKNPALAAKIVYVPAAFRPDWEQAAKLYYALDNLKLNNKDINAKIFTAAHLGDSKTMFVDEKVLDKFLVSTLGAEKAKNVQTEMRSFGVNGKISNTKALTAAYKVDSTPLFVVDTLKGEQYRVDPGITKGFPGLLNSINQFSKNKCD